MSARRSTTFLLFALLAALVEAQSARWSRILIDMEQPGAIVSDTGELEDLAHNNSVAQTGVTSPGSFFRLGVSSYLIAGADVGNGVVEWWARLANGPLVLMSRTTRIGSDFCGIAYDRHGARLYVLDAARREILEAPWIEGDPLPVSWTTWANAADAEQIRDAADHDLMMVEDVSGEPPVVYIGYHPELWTCGTTLRGTPGCIVAKIFCWFDSSEITSILADSTTATEGGTSVKVDAIAGRDVDVIDVQTGNVIGGARVPWGASSVVVPLWEPLQLGRRYVARYLGEPWNPALAFTCMRRYGSPGATSEGTQLRSVYFPHAHVGDPAFTLMIGVARNTAPGAEVRVNGWLGLAARTALGDPVRQVDGDWMITPDLVVEADGVIGITGSAIVGGTFAIPADPSLAGVVVLGQFALTDGGTRAFSEVFGFTLAPP